YGDRGGIARGHLSNRLRHSRGGGRAQGAPRNGPVTGSAPNLAFVRRTLRERHSQEEVHPRHRDDRKREPLNRIAPVRAFVQRRRGNARRDVPIRSSTSFQNDHEWIDRVWHARFERAQIQPAEGIRAPRQDWRSRKWLEEWTRITGRIN